MPTFKEINEELNIARSKRAVLSAAIRYLYEHLDYEGRKASRVLDDDAVGEVPQEIIEETVDELEERFVQPLDNRITKIERMRLQDGEEVPEESPSEKGTSPKRKQRAAKGKGKKGTSSVSKRSSRRTAKRVQLGGGPKARRGKSDNSEQSEESGEESRATG